MTDTPAFLAERLRAEGEKTLDFFRALSPEHWTLELYTDGSCWTVRQLLAHFVATEAGFQNLIENILSEGPGAPEDFDINRYNERKVASLQEFSVSNLLAQFAEGRRGSIRLVEGMHAEDLLRTGRHPFLGVVPLEEIVKLLYRHNQIHQRDVRRRIATP